MLPLDMWGGRVEMRTVVTASSRTRIRRAAALLLSPVSEGQVFER